MNTACSLAYIDAFFIAHDVSMAGAFPAPLLMLKTRPGESTNNLIPLGHAASMLYYAYGLIHYRRLGIGVHLCNINVFRSLADCL